MQSDQNDHLQFACAKYLHYPGCSNSHLLPSCLPLPSLTQLITRAVINCWLVYHPHLQTTFPSFYSNFYCKIVQLMKHHKKKLYNSFHQFEKELMHNLHATSLDAQLHPTCRICWKIHANNSHVIWQNNMAFAITLLPNISHLPSTLNLVESPYHM